MIEQLDDLWFVTVHRGHCFKLKGTHFRFEQSQNERQCPSQRVIELTLPRVIEHQFGYNPLEEGVQCIGGSIRVCIPSVLWVFAEFENEIEDILSSVPFGLGVVRTLRKWKIKSVVLIVGEFHKVD